MQQSNIRFSVHGCAGLVVLDRPRSLNALDYEMAVSLRTQLAMWDADAKVSHVVMTGSTPRAFCAGGDVRALYEMITTGANDQVPVYFQAEYLADAAVFDFSKPIISLCDGVVMGGGAGLMQACSHAIVSETTRFAMPECKIGLFPDAGASLFLSRCPRQIGLFLGLTGQIISGADCLMLGLATSMTRSDDMEKLRDELLASDGERIEMIIARYKHDPGPAPLQQQRAAIDFIFAGDDLVKMRQNAHDMATIKGDAFADKIHHALSNNCPMSMAVFLRLMQMSEQINDIGSALTLDYHLAIRMSERADFCEGVRAALINKSNDPAWVPDRLEVLTVPMVDVVFDHTDLPPLR